jgi:hypothetical protein
MNQSHPVRIVGNFSGGLGSWAAAKLAGVDTLLFADTLVEDDDLYRFLLDAACNVFSLPARGMNLLREVRSIPPVTDMPARRDRLEYLRSWANAYFCGRLVWLAEGRTPWEVFRDERFLGNSKADPCSKILKRQLLDRWFEANCPRPTTRCVVGLGWWERHRFEGRSGKPGLRDRMAAKGWTFVAPLIDHKPTLDKHDIRAWAEREGLEVSRAYDDGFDHDNCGGECVKAGQSHWLKMLTLRPDRYGHAEGQENALRGLLGDVAMMTERKAGKKIPLPLTEFRRRVEAREELSLVGGAPCGCFTGEDD